MQLQLQYIIAYKDKSVTLDKDRALSDGFSPDSIDIVTEIVNTTNQIVKSGYIDNFKNTKSRALKEYLEKNMLNVSNRSYSIYANSNDPVSVCWGFWNPLPNRAAPWYGITMSSQYSHNYLLNIWFHKTEETYGWGYTRPQFYRPDVCWYGTFRDHAYISGNTVRIQDYANFTPRWEPNPEIQNYFWPYYTWPAYVAWWHSVY